MNNSQTQLNPGSNGSDFQPSTQNPQTGNTSNLQTQGTSVQPVQTNGASSAEQLYQQADRQPGLSVQTDSYSTNSQVSVRPFEPSSNNGLITVSGSLVILLLIVVIIGRYWRQTPEVVPAPEAVEVAPPPKPATKSPTPKKKTKAQKKRSKRK